MDLNDLDSMTHFLKQPGNMEKTFVLMCKQTLFSFLFSKTVPSSATNWVTFFILFFSFLFFFMT